MDRPLSKQGPTWQPPIGWLSGANNRSIGGPTWTGDVQEDYS